jgi:hypothetical protein
MQIMTHEVETEGPRSTGASPLLSMGAGFRILLEA